MQSYAARVGHKIFLRTQHTKTSSAYWYQIEHRDSSFEYITYKLEEENISLYFRRIKNVKSITRIYQKLLDSTWFKAKSPNKTIIYWQSQPADWWLADQGFPIDFEVDLNLGSNGGQEPNPGPSTGLPAPQRTHWKPKNQDQGGTVDNPAEPDTLETITGMGDDQEDDNNEESDRGSSPIPTAARAEVNPDPVPSADSPAGHTDPPTTTEGPQEDPANELSQLIGPPNWNHNDIATEQPSNPPGQTVSPLEEFTKLLKKDPISSKQYDEWGMRAARISQYGLRIQEEKARLLDKVPSFIGTAPPLVWPCLHNITDKMVKKLNEIWLRPCMETSALLIKHLEEVVKTEQAELLEEFSQRGLQAYDYEQIKHCYRQKTMKFQGLNKRQTPTHGLQWYFQKNGKLVRNMNVANINSSGNKIPGTKREAPAEWQNQGNASPKRPRHSSGTRDQPLRSPQPGRYEPQRDRKAPAPYHQYDRHHHESRTSHHRPRDDHYDDRHTNRKGTKPKKPDDRRQGDYKTNKGLDKGNTSNRSDRNHHDRHNTHSGSNAQNYNPDRHRQVYFTDKDKARKQNQEN